MKKKIIKKRMMAGVVALLMTVANIPITTLVAEEAVHYEFVDLDNNGTKETMIYSGNGDTPAGTYNVNDWENIEGFNEVTSIVFEQGIKSIGAYLFSNCTNIQNVEIKNNVDISKQAFCKCSNLRSLTLGSDIHISESAFEGIGIEKLEINGNNVDTYSSAFQDCTNLKELVVYGDDFFIGSSTFIGCDNLSKISFNGENVKISMYAFAELPISEINFSKNPGALSSGSFGGINMEIPMELIAESVYYGMEKFESLLEEGEDPKYESLPDDLVGNIDAVIEELVNSLSEKLESGEEPNYNDIQLEIYSAIYDVLCEYPSKYPDNDLGFSTNKDLNVNISLPDDWSFKPLPSSEGVWYGIYFSGSPKTNTYTLTIPAETIVETCGYTQLNGNLNISSGDLDSNKCVVVKAEKDDFKCAANNGKIEYTLKYGDNKQNFDLSNGIKWTSSDVEGNGKPVTIGIDIDEQEYLAAPDGEYEGSIKWIAKLQLAN